MTETRPDTTKRADDQKRTTAKADRAKGNAKEEMAEDSGRGFEDTAYMHKNYFAHICTSLTPGARGRRCPTLLKALVSACVELSNEK